MGLIGWRMLNVIKKIWFKAWLLFHDIYHIMIPWEYLYLSQSAWFRGKIERKLKDENEPCLGFPDHPTPCPLGHYWLFIIIIWIRIITFMIIMIITFVIIMTIMTIITIMLFFRVGPQQWRADQAQWTSRRFSTIFKLATTGGSGLTMVKLS